MEDFLTRGSAWVSREDVPVLEKTGIHVWRLFIPDIPRDGAHAGPVSESGAAPQHRPSPQAFLEINDAPPRLERLGAWLTPDERLRAGRYHFDADRRRFAWTRGVLRALLASYVGCAPARIHFGAGPHGKLHLDPACDGLRFNVSHSHEWALIALARDRDLGVDVEHHRPLRHDLFAIASRFFAPAEVAALRALDRDAQEPAFYRIWSRKEAYIKATGQGVSAGLDTFEVSIGTDRAVALRVHDRPDEEARWTMQSLEMGPDYGAALAVERAGERIGAGADVDLKLWEWPRPPA
jgi:4'-phosphopantetheinyl transferase